MLDDDTWQDAFKRGILLGDAKITPVELLQLAVTGALFRQLKL